MIMSTCLVVILAIRWKVSLSERWSIVVCRDFFLFTPCARLSLIYGILLRTYLLLITSTSIAAFDKISLIWLPIFLLVGKEVFIGFGPVSWRVGRVAISQHGRFSSEGSLWTVQIFSTLLTSAVTTHPPTNIIIQSIWFGNGSCRHWLIPLMIITVPVQTCIENLTCLLVTWTCSVGGWEKVFWRILPNYYLFLRP